jgi:hypothetical protein
MSGFKRAMVTISEEEYRQLHNADIEKRFKIGRAAPENHERSQNVNMEKNLRDLETRQSDYENLILRMGNEISRMEIETGQAILTERVNFYRQISDQADEIWLNSTRLETIVESLHEQNMIESQRQEQNTRIIAEQLNQMTIQQAGERDQKNAYSLELLQACSGLIEFIGTTYDHNRFAPGEISKIYRQLDLIQINLSRGLPEASLVIGQQAYSNLAELRSRLELQTLEWQSMYQLASSSARNLFDLLKNNSTCPAMDLEGHELPFSLQLNFWSNGCYADLFDRLKSTIKSIRENLSTISARQLEIIFQETIPGFRDEFDNIIYQARFEAINSQLRINIADIALEALLTQGFEEDGCGYVSNDKRSPYYLHLKNIEGSEVTIWVNPVDNQENRSDLLVESRDLDHKTERELFLRSKGIIQSLLSRGLRVSDLEQLPENSPKINFGTRISANQEKLPLPHRVK